MAIPGCTAECSLTTQQDTYNGSGPIPPSFATVIPQLTPPGWIRCKQACNQACSLDSDPDGYEGCMTSCLDSCLLVFLNS
jgi:hypothetical protein